MCMCVTLIHRKTHMIERFFYLNNILKMPVDNEAISRRICEWFVSWCLRAKLYFLSVKIIYITVITMKSLLEPFTHS